MVITSTSNEQIKKLIQLKEKSKVRKTTGTFTVEGKKMFVEIPAEDLVSVYVSETFLKENGELVKEKKYQIDELDNYNGLHFLWNKRWE